MLTIFLERFNINHYDLFNIKLNQSGSCPMGIFRPPATSNQKDSAWGGMAAPADPQDRRQGFGDILVRGNPPHRDHSVAGSRQIKF